MRSTPQYPIGKNCYVTTTRFSYFGLLSSGITYNIPSETTVQTANPQSLNWILCKQLLLSSQPAFRYYFHWVIKKVFRVRQRWWYSTTVLLPPLSTHFSEKYSSERAFRDTSSPDGRSLPAAWSHQRNSTGTVGKRLLKSKQKPQMTWWEQNSGYLNLQLLIVKY